MNLKTHNKERPDHMKPDSLSHENYNKGIKHVKTSEKKSPKSQKYTK